MLLFRAGSIHPRVSLGRYFLLFGLSAGRAYALLHTNVRAARSLQLLPFTERVVTITGKYQYRNRAQNGNNGKSSASYSYL
jgi:hypothetical protein